MKYCESCKKECGVEKTNVSFDHEFGTEVGFSYSSDCCGADMYEDICESCGGEGEVRDDECYTIFNGANGMQSCPDCDGIGLTKKVEITDDDDLIDFDAISKDERSEIEAGNVFIK